MIQNKTTLLILITSIALLAACKGDNGKGKQNSNHSLINNPPIPQEQNLTLKEDTQTEITLKATDVDKDTIGYRVSQKPTHGTLKGKAPHLTYIPNKDYNGIDSFSFIANDGAEDSKEPTVALNITPVADLKAIKLTIDKTTLNKDTNTTYNIKTTLDKGEVTKELQQKIENIQIIPEPKDAIKIDTKNRTIQVLKDGNITIYAKTDTITSNPITLNVYWEVNGHRLPPEPDPKVNNATVLGVDSNNNGVRDDVERTIYRWYGKKHPIYAAIAMEAAKSYQMTLKGKKYWEEAHGLISKISSCEAYYSAFAKFHNEKLLIDKHERPSADGLLLQVMNTKERQKMYVEYDASLSGGVYSLPSDSEAKRGCPDSIKEVLK